VTIFAGPGLTVPSDRIQNADNMDPTDIHSIRAIRVPTSISRIPIIFAAKLWNETIAFI